MVGDRMIKVEEGMHVVSKNNDSRIGGRVAVRKTFWIGYPARSLILKKELR